MSENNAYVYGHYKADTGELFYIGKGIGKRAWEKRRRNDHWNNTVNKHGYIVKILHENLSEEEAFNKERELIEEVGLQNLANMVEGGRGFTKEFSENLWKNPKFLKKMQEIYSSDEWYSKLKEGMKRMAQNPEWRKKNKERAQKRAQDPEWRKKNKEAMQKNSQNPEWKRKHKEEMQKRAQDSEWRRKNKEAAQKNSQNPELRRKLKELGRQRAQDIEWRQKMKDGHYKRRKDAILVSPTGEIIHIHGIGEFANLHKLHAGNLSDVINKTRKSHKGWTLYQPEEDHKISEFL